MVRIAEVFVPSSVSGSLTVFGHSYLTAVLENGTNRALGKSSRANVLPEGNEKAVYLNPVLAGKVLSPAPAASYREMTCARTPTCSSRDERGYRRLSRSRHTRFPG